MKIPYGEAGEIPPVDVRCVMDGFENMIREMGVISACEWFGYNSDSEFTKETIKTLCRRSGIEIIDIDDSNPDTDTK